MPVDWHREPLDWMLARRFSRVIREGDRVECYAGGMSPYQSMRWAVDSGGGECWAVMIGDHDRVPAGVYGWTNQGAIWSYWRNLSAGESRELVRRTPEMVTEMVEHSERDHLANYVWEFNAPAIAWLRLCGCFDLDVDHRYTISNKQFVSFRTKPLEELRQCVAH